MKLEFRQRLLSSTLLVGASMVATPAFSQVTAPQTKVCPNGAVVLVTAPCPLPPPGTNQAPDTSAVTTIPETTTPPAGQTVVTQSATGEEIDSPIDIVVTGTRIPQPNLEAASPVTVVTAQEVKLSGTTRTEDLINSLPQSFAAQGSNVSNGSTGTATVNLRGLGPSRTMVLINGRRAQPGDPRQPVADINFIPAPLIRRVDVLTGGASSVYGADAVAGVVNFIMDTTFRGLRIDGQASTFWHHNDTEDDIIAANEARGFRPPSGNSVNGGAVDLAVALGAGFDDNRGNVMGYATYRKQDAVLQATRDYSFCALEATEDPAEAGRRFNCGGSGTSATGTFFQFNPVTFAGRPAFQTSPGGTFVPGSTPFNFAPYNFYQRPQERYTLGVFADYEIGEMFNPYLEAMFMDDKSDATIAPSGDFGNTNTLNCDNPLMSAQQQAFLCDNPAFPTFTDANGIERALVYTLRRNVEGGGRNDDLQHTAYRLVGGLRGDLHRGLSYDSYYQYGITNLIQTYENDFSVTRLNRALDVVTDPETGEPVCRAVLNGTDPNCVPWNIFSPGGVTQEALNYLQTPGFANGNVRQQIAQIDFTVLGSEYGMILPWSDRGLGLNAGAAYVKNALVYRTDTAFETGDLAGQGGPTIGVEGAYDVRELFAEVELPVVSRSFIEEFTLRAGYRYSDYKVANNSFSTDTYKVEAELAPVRDVRFRGSYNRAVRAPNVVELFSAQQIGLDGTNDPCANQPTTGRPSATLEQCQRTGVTAAQYGQIVANPANQYNALFGGNVELSPESADTYTLGVVLQPRFVPGLAVTVDWFDITIEDLVSVPGGTWNTVMNQCLTSGQLCEFIHRAPGTGSLWLPVIDPDRGGFIDQRNTNIGGLSTSGIDLQASYARGIGALGNMNLSFVGTWLDELVTNPFGDVEFDCVGFFGGPCGQPNPEWRHKFRAGITMPSGIGISGQWRYFAAVENDTLSENPVLHGGEGPHSAPGNARLSAASFLDLALTARMAERYNFRFGINNILDREPGIVGSEVAEPPFGNGNTFPQVYDALGRFVFAGVTVDF